MGRPFPGISLHDCLSGIRRLGWPAGLLFMFLAPLQTAAQTTIGELSCGQGCSGWNNEHYGYVADGQTFTVGETDRLLTSFTFGMWLGANPQTFLFNVYLWGGSAPVGTSLGSVSATGNGSSTPSNVTFETSAGILLDPDEVYVALLTRESGSGVWGILRSFTSDYADGMDVYSSDGINYASRSGDALFSATFASVSVPEPLALLLIAPGLLSVALAYRRRHGPGVAA